MRVVLVAIVILFALSGCLGVLPDDGETATPERPTDTHTPTITATVTPTETPTETKTRTDTDTRPRSKAEKYEFYTGVFTKILNKNGIAIADLRTDPENVSMVLKYTMENPDNASLTRLEEEHILKSYAGTIHQFNESDDVSATWIPRYLEIRALDPDDGGLYMYSSTNYTMAERYLYGNVTSGTYYTDYFNSIQFGPSHE